MRMGTNRRLANVKTRHETGLDYIMQSMNLNTPFGKKQLKELMPSALVQKQEPQKSVGAFTL